MKRRRPTPNGVPRRRHGATASAVRRGRTIASRFPFALPGSRASGFTLVELMVVLFVVGIAGAAVLLTAPGDSARLAHEADSLAARLLRAREEAVLANRAVRVRVTEGGYDFARQDFDAWRPLHEGPFGPVRFADGVRARMPGAARQAQVTFRFDPAGGDLAQDVLLEGHERRVRVALDDGGEISVDALP